MKTRWNKKLVDETIDRIIKATTIPARREALSTDLKNRLVDAIKAAQPPEFYQALEKYPKSWFKAIGDVYVGWEDIRGIQSLSCVKQKHSSNITLDDLVYTTTGGSGLTSKDLRGILDDVAQSCQLLYTEEADLRAELRALIASHHTVEAMAKAVPELAQHLPESAAPKTMAVTVLPSNALAALQKAGMQMVVAE